MSEHKDYIELIQVSDPHLFADTGRGLYGLNSHHCLSQVIADLGKRHPDLIMATGDLVHDETEAGYELFHNMMNAIRVPVYCIPGNHDDMVYMRAVLSGGHVSCNKTVVLEQWQIILLNSQLPGRVEGRLAQAELDYLELALQSHPDKQAVVFLHHQPVPVGSAWLDRLALTNPQALFAVTDRFPQVKAIVWGHVHQVFESERNGVQLISTPSTCIQFKPGVDDFQLDNLPPGYRWIRLYDDGRLESAVVRLNCVPGHLDVDAAGY